MATIGNSDEAAAAAACRNCCAPLAGAHCHGCGQKARIHDDVGAFFHDLAHSVLHFEGKLWRTLPLLAWRPGHLTRRYIEGERARFVSPLAAFLFSVFLMFAAFGIAGGPIATTTHEVRIGTDNLYYVPSLGKVEERLREDREQLVAYRKRLIGRGDSAEALAETSHEIATLDRALAALGEGRRNGPGAAAPAGQQRTAVISLGGLTRWIFAKIGENPPLVVADVQNKAYKFSWTLIPLSVPFLWLLMIGNRRNRLYDHVVFVTYSLSFVTLLLVLMTLLRPIGLIDLVALPFPFLVAWHMYRQLKGAYALSAKGALWRTALLLAFALLVSILFIMLLVAAA